MVGQPLDLTFVRRPVIRNQGIERVWDSRLLVSLEWLGQAREQPEAIRDQDVMQERAQAERRSRQRRAAGWP